MSLPYSDAKTVNQNIYHKLMKKGGENMAMKDNLFSMPKPNEIKNDFEGNLNRDLSFNSNY